MNATYLKYETLRIFRNKQNFVFSLVFPVILFFAIAGPNRNTIVDAASGVNFPTYYMAGMIGFGTMGAVIAGGARIAFERDAGWTRQLRITPLTAPRYFTAKVLTSYLMAIISIVVLYLCGLSLHVRMPLSHWLAMTGLILVALIPFAALGVFLGHVIKGDSMGPVMGGGMSLFALVGGAWFPIGGTHGFMYELVRLIPSFWLIHAGQAALGGNPWTFEAWLVIAAWSAVLVYGAVWAYRRDTGRV